jgi:hypothetical protein
VTQPNYFQTGGINNPSRSMEFDINGTPTGLTVVRIDGITATNQWIAGLQAYTPGLGAIQTVNSATSTSDAEQGLSGGATVSVQVKRAAETSCMDRHLNISRMPTCGLGDFFCRRTWANSRMTRMSWTARSAAPSKKH